MLDLIVASKETSVQLVAMGLLMLLAGRYWKAVCTKKATQENPEEPGAKTIPGPLVHGHEVSVGLTRPGSPRNYAVLSAQRNLESIPARDIRLAGRNLPPVPST